MRNRFLIVLLVVVLIASCANPFFPEKKVNGTEGNISVSISSDSTDVFPGDTLQFSAMVNNSANQHVTWSVMGDGLQPDTDISTDGLLTVSINEAINRQIIVTAVSVEDKSKSDSVIVTVKEPVVILPYTIVIVIHGAQADDSIIVDPDSGNEGDEITINYTVADILLYNILDFGGVSLSITGVTSAGTGTRTYIINSADAADGVITIIATFEHTNLELDPITFSNTDGHINIIYGDSFANAITTAHSGIGDISYISSVPSVATVDDNGAITILKVGSTIITAEKDADEIYAHASRSYTLTIDPKPVTITGITAENKVFDGTTIATYNKDNAQIEGILPVDIVTINYTAAAAAFENASAGDNKNVSFSGFALAGADAANYSLTQPVSVKANITKAAGFAVDAPEITGNTNTSITIAGVPEPASGQPVEYNISHASNGSSFLLENWQSGTDFTGLETNKTYYVYARSAESGNYSAGVPSTASEPVTLHTFTLFVEDIINPEITVINSGLTIYRNSEPTTGTITVTGTGENPIEWWYGNHQLGDEATLTLNSSDIRYNMTGSKFVTVIVTIEGKPYSQRVWFDVQHEEE